MKSSSEIFGRILKTSRIEELSSGEIISALKEKLTGRVKKAFIFGSIAVDAKGPSSDIDLIIVQETEKIFTERALDYSDLYELGCEVDILVYTPEEFEKLTTEPTIGFWKTVVDEMIRIL